MKIGFSLIISFSDVDFSQNYPSYATHLSFWSIFVERNLGIDF